MWCFLLVCVPAQLLHYVILYSQSRRRVAPQRQKWQFSYTAAQLHSSPHCTDCPVLSRRILQRTNFIRLVETKKKSLPQPSFPPTSSSFWWRGRKPDSPISFDGLCTGGEKKVDPRTRSTIWLFVFRKSFDYLPGSVRQENNVFAAQQE